MRRLLFAVWVGVAALGAIAASIWVLAPVIWVISVVHVDAFHNRPYRRDAWVAAGSQLGPYNERGEMYRDLLRRGVVTRGTPRRRVHARLGLPDERVSRPRTEYWLVGRVNRDGVEGCLRVQYAKDDRVIDFGQVVFPKDRKVVRDVCRLARPLRSP